MTRSGSSRAATVTAANPSRAERTSKLLRWRIVFSICSSRPVPFARTILYRFRVMRGFYHAELRTVKERALEELEEPRPPCSESQYSCPDGDPYRSDHRR